MSCRTNLEGARTPRPNSGQCLALLLSGVGLMAGCYLTLDSDALDAKAAG